MVERFFSGLERLPYGLVCQCMHSLPEGQALWVKMESPVEGLGMHAILFRSENLVCWSNLGMVFMMRHHYF